MYSTLDARSSRLIFSLSQLKIKYPSGKRTQIRLPNIGNRLSVLSPDHESHMENSDQWYGTAVPWHLSENLLCNSFDRAEEYPE
jgi:hypothetical protein